MTTYLLVPGFWLGGWAWDAVAAPLRAAGHDVHQVSLTLDPGITASDHVEQVAELLDGLRDVVLVGHSYAGAVITAAADRLPDRVARLVYVDTGPLPDGMSQAEFDGSAPDAPDGMIPIPAEAPAPAQGFDWAIVRERGRAQPVGTATEPVRHGEAWRGLARTAILCSFSAAQLRGLAATVPAFALMSGESWTVRELPTGHWPMFSRPEDLASLLAGN
ncbi:putative esterase [Actinoplanes missouriensis 431]|uniref:Putative esterase n=1 Tax=Actinoplanes missouriensis (strain ATCC 14538 / DSM 43046 / CBS 188.64 / JCM 3121 / NBRC 102363 / NCIMB 12654 / NRRL B-3342 / UNCC 431) TaxID=512565 RepID=I0HA82_ACTM4|nr:alpha/beta hydrolase [Actinoplanes missouriensis]BAL89919.1 putative esterase [Actinoplanes missouriensis 431]